MQASRPRRQHTPAVIKLPRIPNGIFSPRAKPHCDRQTLGVSHDLPRRSPSGRRRAPPFCQTSQTSQTGQTSQTQASRPRREHTAVAINLRRQYPESDGSRAEDLPFQAFLRGCVRRCRGSRKYKLPESPKQEAYWHRSNCSLHGDPFPMSL